MALGIKKSSPLTVRRFQEVEKGFNKASKLTKDDERGWLMESLKRKLYCAFREISSHQLRHGQRNNFSIASQRLRHVVTLTVSSFLVLRLNVKTTSWSNTQPVWMCVRLQKAGFTQKIQLSISFSCNRDLRPPKPARAVVGRLRDKTTTKLNSIFILKPHLTENCVTRLAFNIKKSIFCFFIKW